MKYKLISSLLFFGASLLVGGYAFAQAGSVNDSIKQRIVATPSNSTNGGGAAYVAIPQNICTATNNNCYNPGFLQPAAVAATIRPWTSYFLGQTKTQPGSYRGAVQVVTPPNARPSCNEDGCNYRSVDQYFPDTTVNIDAAGVIYARQTGSLFYSAIGTPSGFENVTWTVRGACVVSPTWSNNSNKLAGLPPDGWAHSGQLNGTNVGCGPLVESALNGAAGDGG